MDEASGLAASLGNPGVFWTHNDSGDQARVFALGSSGQHLGEYTIQGATNRDWEDIATGPGPDPETTYLYIGEIGDNSAVHDVKYIYRVPEPHVNPAQAPVDTTLTEVEKLSFQYPDGRRDAETLLVDPLTRDLYVISKRESSVRVYRAPYPQPVGPTITLEHVATLPMTMVVGGDISSSGREILLKTYTQMFHWCREEPSTIADALNMTPVAVPYTQEPQGEAVAWGADGLDYFTTSEETSGIPAHLYRYPREESTSSIDWTSERAAHGTFSTPNPFRGTTTIHYSLESESGVHIVVRAADGRLVRSLIRQRQSAGVHALDWDGRGDSGELLPAGVYYYTLSTGGAEHQGRVVLVR